MIGKNALRLCAIAVFGFALRVSAAEYPCRWVFLWDNLQADASYMTMSNVVYNAKACGYNGLVLYCGDDFGGKWDDVRATVRDDAEFVSGTCGMDCLKLWNPNRLTRLRTLKRLCASVGFEFTVFMWSVGYCSMQAFDPNMAAVFPIRDVPYKRNGDRLVFGDPIAILRDGNLDDPGTDGALFKGWVDEKPGVLVFRDEEIRHSGRASARFDMDRASAECSGRMPMARLRQRLSLKPNRRYRVSAWVKTRNLRGKGSRVAVYTPEDKMLQVRKFPITGTKDWTYVEVFFNSQDATAADLLVGGWEAKSGTIWFDDVVCEEVGLQQVVSRAGAPVRVVDAKSGRLYETGRDYVLPQLRVLSFDSPQESLEIAVPTGSAIPDGNELLISAYEPVTAFGVQFSACLSNPELKPFYEESARWLARELAPRHVILSADEVRVGCRCELCRASGKGRAQLLADQIWLQRSVIRKVLPDVTLYAWGDMFDENQNACANYFLNDGTYVGGADLLPKDIIMAPWWCDVADKALARFSAIGLKTLVMGYYDVRPVDATIKECRRWIDAMNKTPGCLGIVFTPWSRNYQHMPIYSHTLRKYSKPMP